MRALVKGVKFSVWIVHMKNKIVAVRRVIYDGSRDSAAAWFA